LSAEPQSPAPEAAPRPAGSTRRALKRFDVVVATFVAIAACTYVVPGLERFRPWVPGETPPLSRLLHLEQPEALDLVQPAFAVSGMAGASTEKVVATLRRQLGDNVADNLGSAVGVTPSAPASPAPTPPPVKAAPAKGSAAKGAPAGADAASKKEPAKKAAAKESPPPIRISDGELKGLAARIEDPSGAAMSHFYRAMIRVARKEPGAVARIAHYGDSTIATDGITHTVRRGLQRRFGDAGHGFVLIAKGHMPYRHKDLHHKASKDWKLFEMLRGKLRDGRYGYGGVQYRSRGGAKAVFGTAEDAPVGTRLSRFDLFYQGHKRGGDLELRVDGGEPTVLSPRSDLLHDAMQRIELEDGPHRLEIRAAGKGQVRLYGVAMERDVPGVVYDSLGLVGLRARRFLNADRGHLSEQIRMRDPHLIILAFGGNEAGERKMRMSWYEKKSVEVIKHVRAGKPEASCLLFAPLDQAERDDRGQVRTIPVIKKIVKSQRRVAAQTGCAFFNTFESMGGEGAMSRWFRSRPRLAWGDFRHATPAGYEVIGNMFRKALLAGLRDYVERSYPQPKPAKAAPRGEPAPAAMTSPTTAPAAPGAPPGSAPAPAPSPADAGSRGD